MQIKICVVLAALVCVAYSQGGDSHHSRPGQCVPQITQQRCRNECRSDRDCRDRTEKCCPTTCGGSICNEPMTASTTTTRRPPYTVPTTRRPAYTVPPTNRGTKPGTCPGPLAQFNCQAECQNDASCRGNQKCCPTTCGGSQCKAPGTATTTTTTTSRPSGGRPGQCPSAAPRANGRQDPPCRDQCKRDRDCRNNGYKCCNNSCGANECMAPVFN